MRRTPKTVLTALAAAGLLLGGGAGAAGADSPGPGGRSAGQLAATPMIPAPSPPKCKASSANHIGTYENPGWAELKVYWDPVHKSNCAYLWFGEKVPAGEHTAKVIIYTCKTSTKGELCYAVEAAAPYYEKDKGPFGTYAGKVSAKGVGKGGKPKCVYAYGYVKAKGKKREVDSYRDGVIWPIGNHCG